MGKKEAQQRLTFWTLVWRSLRFHVRAHLGVVLGAAVGSAALIGALIVGDSVRETLKERALSRLGGAYYALHTVDRCFETGLNGRLSVKARGARLPSVTLGAPAYVYADSASPLSAALMLPGVVAKGDGSARANGVNVIGVRTEDWPPFAGWWADPWLQAFSAKGGAPSFSLQKPPPAPRNSAREQWETGQTAFLNETLARQLAVRVDDEIIVRVRKPSALGWEAALSPRDQTCVALRLKVGAILPPEKLGDFSLSAQPFGTPNLFLPLWLLQKQTGAAGQANLLLFGEVQEKPKFTQWDLQRDKAAAWLKGRRPRVVIPGLEPKKEEPLGEAVAVPWLEGQLKDILSPGNVGISVEPVGPRLSETGEERRPSFAEVTSSHLFLEAPVVAAARLSRTMALTNYEAFFHNHLYDGPADFFITNGVGILTYLANLIRAGDHATPYSMVTAADGAYVPADMREDEILVNEWLAEDLKVKPGDSVVLSYYVADSGSRLLERTNSFRVRGIVPLKGIYADRTLMPGFPGLAKAESTHEWDGGFPLVYTIRDKDEAYWKQYRGTPKAFISLAAGQKLWANRFGALTAIRYPVPAGEFASDYRNAAYQNLLANLKPSDLGLRIEPVRAQALRAAVQGQDFGQLFLGFSFFLVVAALLLMALLFQFGLEQRESEVQTLRALGFTARQVRRLFLAEGALLALLGGIVGTFGGYAYAHAMLWGLATIWRSAVGNSVLTFHATQVTLLIGLSASTLVAVVTIWLTLRKLGGLKSKASSLKSKVSSPKARLSRVLRWRRAPLISTPLQPNASPPVAGCQAPCPGGAPENSPTLERWVVGNGGASPEGTAEAGDIVSAVPSGLVDSGPPYPTLKRWAILTMCLRHRCAGAIPDLCRYLWLQRGANERGERGIENAWGIAGLLAGLGAGALVVWALVRGDTANAGAFFGAGALLLLAGLASAAAWLDRLAHPETSERGVYAASTCESSPVPVPTQTSDVRTLKRRKRRAPGALSRGALAMRGCARRRNRSLATIALLACGCFLIVAIGAFRLDANQHPERRSAGTGGFALLGNTTLPLLHDLNSPSGREFFGLNPEDLRGVTCVPFRVREGEDASCLNLARSQKPRLLGVNPELLKGRFTFTQVASGLQREWSVLQALNSTPQNPKSEIENLKSKIAEVPAVADANTIEWGLGKKLGDTLDYTDDQGRPFKVRLVGAVANSILQGSLLIDETEFVRRFPNESGHRMVLLDAPADSVPQVSATLTRALQDLGLELIPAAQRLNVLNAVENTYLSTFQVLGGLGLLLGSAGLGVVVLRNVLERRAELALLLAVGFRRRALERLVLLEHAALLAAGLGIGMVAALVAVLPALWSARASLPCGSLALTLLAVCLNGLLWAWLATRYALRGNLIQALQKE